MASFAMRCQLYFTLGFLVILCVQPGLATLWDGILGSKNNDAVDNNRVENPQRPFGAGNNMDFKTNLSMGGKTLSMENQAGMSPGPSEEVSPIEGDVIQFEEPPSTTTTSAPVRYIPPRFQQQAPHPAKPCNHP